MTTIQVTRSGDRAADVGRALANLRRKNEIDGQPDEARRRRFFLSKQEHAKAKKSCQHRVGGKPERKRFW